MQTVISDIAIYSQIFPEMNLRIFQLKDECRDLHRIVPQAENEFSTMWVFD